MAMSNLTWIVWAVVILQIMKTKADQNLEPKFLKHESKHPEPGKVQLKTNGGVLRIKKNIFQGTEIKISVSLPQRNHYSKCAEDLVFGYEIQEIDCDEKKIIIFDFPNYNWKKFKNSMMSENNNVKNCHKSVFHLPTDDLITKDGNYLLKIGVEKNIDEVTIELEFFGDYGYQLDWPFYQYLYHLFVCALCIGLLIGIFVVLIFFRKEMGKMQYCMTMLMMVYMLEEWSLFIEIEYMRSEGIIIPDLVPFINVISNFRGALARMFVLLASMGYCGITNKKGSCVLCLLVLSLFISYFFVAWNHSGIDMTQHSFTSSKFGMAKLVIDSWIYVLIFSFIKSTCKFLTGSRNLVKLTWYQYFTIILIFGLFANISNFIWKYVALSKMGPGDCFSSSEIMRMSELFGHIIFSLQLFANFLLWMPTKKPENTLISTQGLVNNIEESNQSDNSTTTEELFQKLDPCDNHLETFEDSDRIVIENENQIILTAALLRSNSFVDQKLKIDLRVAMEEKRAQQQCYSRQTTILENNLDDDFEGDFVLMKALAKSENSEYDLKSINKNMKNNEGIDTNPDVSGNCDNIDDKIFLKNILEKISEIEMEPQSIKVVNNDHVISKDKLPKSGFAKLLSELRLKLFS